VRFVSKLIQSLMVLVVLGFPIGLAALVRCLMADLSNPAIPRGLSLVGGVLGWALIIAMALGFIRLVFPAARRLAGIWRPKDSAD
jgi:hypothetical protein